MVFDESVFQKSKIASITFVGIILDRIYANLEMNGEFIFRIWYQRGMLRIVKRSE